MPEQNLQLARQVYDAWNRDDLEWLLELMTDDFEFRSWRRERESQEVYRRHAGWRRFWDLWHKEWPAAEVQVLRLQDMGRHGVLGLVSFEGTRRGENDEEEKVSQPLAHWLSFREEKLSAITALPAEVAERRREVRG